MSRNCQNSSNYQDSDAKNTRDNFVKERFVTISKLSTDYLLAEIKLVVIEMNGLEYENQSSILADFGISKMSIFRGNQIQ